ITDPVQECAPYWYPPSDSYPKFPDMWTAAKILSGDTAAQNKWNEIKGRIPNIAPKGKNGDFSSVKYDNSKDPDCWWTATGCVDPKAAGLPSDISKIPEPQSLGYGFDDGPNCTHNAFYDFLSKNNQKATMFFIGSNVINWPLQAQRAYYDGHEICGHSWSHSAMTSLSSEQAFAEVYYTIQVIKAVTGVTITCWRPPYGDTDDRIRAIVNALGLTTVLWQYDSNDWVGGSEVDKNYQTFIGQAKGGEFSRQGTIYLQHEIEDFTMNKAMQYYPDMKDAFKNIVPVAVALNKTHPYLETNIEFPTFDECKPSYSHACAGTPSSSSSPRTVANTSSSASSRTSSSSSSSTRTSSSSTANTPTPTSIRQPMNTATPPQPTAPTKPSPGVSANDWWNWIIGVIKRWGF
ncbi:glycoside hydrolase/deacetylase, partial [Marasmius fiardii PR-910]